MKFVDVKWHRGGCYEKRGARKAALKNARRTIRQKSNRQLAAIKINFKLSEHEIVSIEWHDGMLDNTPIAYSDNFMHPSVRLSYFFD